MSEKSLLELLDADLLPDDSTVYPELVSFFSESSDYVSFFNLVQPRVRRLFDDPFEDRPYPLPLIFSEVPWGGFFRDGIFGW